MLLGTWIHYFYVTLGKHCAFYLLLPTLPTEIHTATLGLNTCDIVPVYRCFFWLEKQLIIESLAGWVKNGDAIFLQYVTSYLPSYIHLKTATDNTYNFDFNHSYSNVQ